MNRKIGRLLDIKSIVYEFKEYEFVNAFQKCLEGTDVMISAYEHDFRNRTEVIHKNFLEPLKKISKNYPEIKWFYKNSLDAFNILNHGTFQKSKNNFTIRFDNLNNLIINAKYEIFGKSPFTFYKKNNDYLFLNFLRIGHKCWLLPKHQVVKNIDLYIACNDKYGNSSIKSFRL